MYSFLYFEATLTFHFCLTVENLPTYLLADLPFGFIVARDMLSLEVMFIASELANRFLDRFWI